MSRRRRFARNKLLVRLILILLFLLLIFHVLVLFQVIPYSIIWGGNIDNFQALVQMETISIIATVLIFLITSFGLSFTIIKGSSRYSLQYRYSLLIIALFFVFNLITNIISRNTIEKLIFIPVTSIFILLYLSLFRNLSR